MKRIGLVGAVVVLLVAAGCDVDSTGIRPPEGHFREVDADTVRVELRDFNDATVITTGEDDNDQGELHSYSVELTAQSEWFRVDYTTTARDILNVTKQDRGGTGYVDIDVDDHLAFFDGDATDDGEPLLKATPWVNARRGAAIEIIVSARELDCRFQRVCDDDDRGSVTLVMSIPPLPDPLPVTCQASNSFQGIQVNGVYRFDNMLDRSRVPADRPIIEPGIWASGARLCFLPPA